MHFATLSGFLTAKEKWVVGCQAILSIQYGRKGVYKGLEKAQVGL